MAYWWMAAPANSSAGRRRPSIAPATAIAVAIVDDDVADNIDASSSRNLGLDWKRNFEVIVSGDDAPNKKPEPDAYHAAIHALGLPAALCLAIEDSRNGLWQRPFAGAPVLITAACTFATRISPAQLKPPTI